VADLLEGYLKVHKDGTSQLNAILVKWVDKLYSVLANSMLDKRWGSHKTCMNTPLHNKESVITIANTIQIVEWYKNHGVDAVSPFSFNHV
jgi:hypothetical protein